MPGGTVWKRSSVSSSQMWSDVARERLKENMGMESVEKRIRKIMTVGTILVVRDVGECRRECELIEMF